MPRRAAGRAGRRCGGGPVTGPSATKGGACQRPLALAEVPAGRPQRPARGGSSPASASLLVQAALGQEPGTAPDVANSAIWRASAALSGNAPLASLEYTRRPSTTTSNDDDRPTEVVGELANADAPAEASARREISAARARALGAYPHMPLRVIWQGRRGSIFVTAGAPGSFNARVRGRAVRRAPAPAAHQYSIVTFTRFTADAMGAWAGKGVWAAPRAAKFRGRGVGLDLVDESSASQGRASRALSRHAPERARVIPSSACGSGGGGGRRPPRWPPGPCPGPRACARR